MFVFQLEADFDRLYPGREVTIYSRWSLFEKKALKLAAYEVKDKYGKALFNSMGDQLSASKFLTPIIG